MPASGYRATPATKLGLDIMHTPQLRLGCLLGRAKHYRPASLILAEQSLHDVVHLGTDPDGLYDLETFALQKVAGDDDLADEAHAQATILGLDDYDPLAFDQLALHERLPEDDDSIKQPLRTLLPLCLRQILLH